MMVFPVFTPLQQHETICTSARKHLVGIEQPSLHEADKILSRQGTPSVLNGKR